MTQIRPALDILESEKAFERCGMGGAYNGSEDDLIKIHGWKERLCYRYATISCFCVRCCIVHAQVTVRICCI